MGNRVEADDGEGDVLTYTLGGTDAASFDIDVATGQLRTKAALDRETKGTYDRHGHGDGPVVHRLAMTVT